MILTAGFIVYLYVLIKVILFKWGSVDIHVLLYQLQRTLDQPNRIFDRQGNYIPFKEIIKEIHSLSISHPFLSTNLIGNILIFIPLGLFIPLLFTSRGASFVKIFMLPLLLSLCFEVTQLLLCIGTFDVDDLILNTAGGIVGYAASRSFAMMKKPRSHKDLVLSPNEKTNVVLLQGGDFLYTRKKAYAAIMLSIAVLSQSLAYRAYAASVDTSSITAASTLDKLGPITLKSSVSAKLTDVGFFAQDSGNILIYTLNYYNGSSSPVKLFDYFSRVTTPGGAIIQGRPLTNSATIQSIAAKSSQSITYFVNMGKATKVNGVKISLYGWDFSSADYQKRLGTIIVPSAYSAALGRGQSKKIIINNLPVTTKAESLQIYKFNGKVYAKIGISFSNTGVKMLTDTGMRGYLTSSGGSVFGLALNDASSGFKIQPQEKKIVYYLTEIPSYMKTDNMSLQFAVEDSTLSISLPVITYKLPAAAAANLVVASNAVKKITVRSNTVETQLKSATVYSENGVAKWSLKFRVKNSGNKSVILPAYELAIKAAEGYTFPVNSKAFANLKLEPLEEKVIDLSADVPLELSPGTLQLQMTEPAVADKIVFPIAYYQIPYSLQTNNLLGMEYTVENSLGTFGVKLNSVQRLPWSDEDQLVTKISIRNSGTAAVQLPVLTGVIKAGESDLSSTSQIVTEDTRTLLTPNETAAVYIVTNVPYSYSFNKLKILLQGTSGGETTNFLTLNTSQLDNTIGILAAGDALHIELAGKKAAVLERLTTVYSGTRANLMYTELVMNSEESRKFEQTQLVAYYKTPDNQYYEAEVNQSTTALNANGKSLVTVWSKIPLAVDTSQLILCIGEGVAEGKLAAPGIKPTAYINMVGLTLNKTVGTPQKSLLDIELFPYSLSVTNTTATISEGEDTLTAVMSYNLSQSELYDAGEYEHKLVLELIDPYGQATEKILTLGTDLSLGNLKSLSTTINSNLYRTLRGGSVRLNIYDEFKGERILLGGQNYSLTYKAVKQQQTTAIPNS
nr:VanZ family protein [Paenibacillus monticola]